MLGLIEHLYSYAEVYAVVLVWVVVPLTFAVTYRRVTAHMDALAVEARFRAEGGLTPPADQPVTDHKQA